MVQANSSQNQGNAVWKPSDVSTFTQQSQNLGNQVGNAGINTGLADVQAQTGKALAKAGQSGQNVAEGASQVATGAQVTPTAAQAPLNVSGGASATIQPYQATSTAPAAPDSTISTPTTIDPSLATLNPNTQSYLSSIFPQGIPQSVLDSINSGISKNVVGSYNPVAAGSIGGTAMWQNQAQQDAFTTPSTAPTLTASGTTPATTPVTTPTPLSPNPQNNIAGKAQLPSDLGPSGTTPTDTSLSTVFQNYLNSLQAGQQSAALDPNVLGQFQNYLQGQLATGQQNLNTAYQGTQNNLANELNSKQSGISNYISGLNTNLQNYTTANQGLSNVGQLSAAEQQAAAKNAVLTGQGATSGPTAGTEALNAVSNAGNTTSRFGVLSQQAQNEALQNAQSQATQAQNINNIGQGQLTTGQTAQANALTKAGTDISTNQSNLLNKLSTNNTAAQQALTSAYNSTGTNLSNQEQSFVNTAQDTLKKANVPESAIQTAVTAFSSTVQNALSNNQLSDQDKTNLVNNLEAIWRISVGTNPSDISFSDKISGILSPIIAQVKGFSATNPTVVAPTPVTPVTPQVPRSRNDYEAPPPSLTPPNTRENRGGGGR